MKYDIKDIRMMQRISERTCGSLAAPPDKP